ncbi:hypothetical protein H257_09925 [Aphanomyces astaci]|uniref:Uncharacterized protein n=1 Tax=Aphanomyces astaci TaxID=112090 RepID=W4G8D9_APHAT|nr:hypothetical protein H257_09925 [Aphanomyces astaci]ETV75967.1 hypothetical protein H257_09925 [Aphanomyces astaci]|eukprot:XP_009834609.1 hypothetical protein H257_09925 [Aphanomyces astaci]
MLPCTKKFAAVYNPTDQGHLPKRNDLTDVTFEIAEILGRSRKTVQSVWREYTKTIVSVSPPSNQAPRKTRIPRTIAVISSIQKFVRDKRQLRARVIAKDVVAFLLETGVLIYDTHDKTQSTTALRCV